MCPHYFAHFDRSLIKIRTKDEKSRATHFVDLVSDEIMFEESFISLHRVYHTEWHKVKALNCPTGTRSSRGCDRVSEEMVTDLVCAH